MHNVKSPPVNLDKNYAVAENKNKSEKREVMKMPRTRKEVEGMEELVGSKKKNSAEGRERATVHSVLECETVATFLHFTSI